MRGNKTLKTKTYLRQTIGANPDDEKNQKRISMVRSVFGKHYNVINRNLLLPLKTKVHNQ